MRVRTLEHVDCLLEKFANSSSRAVVLFGSVTFTGSTSKGSAALAFWRAVSFMVVTEAFCPDKASASDNGFAYLGVLKCVRSSAGSAEELVARVAHFGSAKASTDAASAAEISRKCMLKD